MEIAFNCHYSDVFAITNSRVTFHQLITDDENLTKHKVESKVFFTKDSDVNAEVKCLAWHPSLASCDIIALGQTNGRVSLLSTGLFASTSLPAYRSSVSEFNPKHNRLCNALSWNSFSSHLLAIGLEKSRSGSLIIWDINSRNDFSHSYEKKGPTEFTPSPSSQTVVKPFVETATNESINSLLWLKQDTIIAGVNRKTVRVYDIRTTGPVSSNILHKATSGLCLDPNFENNIACYGDKLVSVFDIRKFSKPVVNISVPYTVAKIEWCPTRREMLGVLFSSHEFSKLLPCHNKLYIYDMLNATIADQELEVSSYQAILRNAQPRITDGEWICGFAWVPPSKERSFGNRVLTATNVMAFSATSVPESTVARWRRQDSFVITSGSIALAYDSPQNQNDLETQKNLSPPPDLATLVHRRVMNGYGLIEEHPSKNAELSLQPGNFGLYELWRWIERVKVDSKSRPAPRTQHNFSLSPAHRPKTSKSTSSRGKMLFFQGVQNILKDSSEEYKPTLHEMIPWIGVANIKSKIYASEKRNFALMLCDWTSPENYGRGEANRFGRNSVGEELVRRIQKSGSTERACAIAVWHLDIKLAIEILNLSSKTAGQGKYSTVAMAMSGYTGTNCPTLWLDTCRQLQNELENSYLQMAFAFLIACAEDTGKFDVILGNKKILLQDRVAFACMYLPDSLLNNFVSSVAVESVKQGSLEGVIVVGLTTKTGVNLLQNYIDKTGDVQTAILAVVHSGDSKFLTENDRIQHWRDSYRNLQNKWQLYFERVNFDLFWNKSCSVRKPSSQVYLHCNYCNKSISNPSLQSAEMKIELILEGTRRLEKTKFPASSTPDRSSRTSAIGIQAQLVFADVVRHHSNPLIDRSRPGVQIRVRHYSGPPTPSRSQGRPYVGGILQQAPATCCPHCRKPLPRCSVCLMHLGSHPDEIDFSKWLSWCMKCRHGGHHGHLKEWFESHRNCPVTDCKCCCSDNLPVSPHQN